MGEPRPLLDTVPIQVPLLQPDPDFHALESSVFRRRLVMEQELVEEQRTGVDTGVTSSQAANMDRELLQMIHQAMKAEREARALELGMLFNSARAMQNAIKLAHVSQLGALAERLTLIAQAKFASKEDLPSKKRTREVKFQEEEIEEEEAGEEEADEGVEDEVDGSQLSQRHALSPVAPHSRGSPAKRMCVEDSPEDGDGESSPMKENTAKQDRTVQKAGGDNGSAKQLFGGSGNPFAKTVASKPQAKTISASLAELGRSKQAKATLKKSNTNPFAKVK